MTEVDLTSRERVRYRGHGLVIASTVELAMETEDRPVRHADIELMWRRPSEIGTARPPGDLLAELTQPDGTMYVGFSRTADSVTLRYPRICDFVGDVDLRRVEVSLHPGADPGLVSVLGSGALISVHLALAGELVLHASCVDVGGQAVAFVGSSGMGKSTMAAMMVRDGWSLVSDDVLRTVIGPDSVTVFPGGIEGRLRDKARSLGTSMTGVGLAETADGRLSVRPSITVAESLPLRAVVIPMPDREVRYLEVRRLGPAEALRRLIRFPRIVGWTDAEILRRQFEASADLAHRVPVFEAVVPWGPPFSREVPGQLLEAVT